MFRPVKLPTGVPGRLLLHSMPGRLEELDAAWTQVTTDAVRLIVCLVPASEISEKSAAYGRAIETGTIPCQLRQFEIPEFGVPHDRAGFWKLARDVAGRLRGGEAVLIHCGAGIGRTGTLAASVLIALGETANRAEEAVAQAGSGTDRAEQRELIAWCATQARETT
jgi:protein-tyrosine phosphatase